jgi:hypothetical protein
MEQHTLKSANHRFERITRCKLTIISESAIDIERPKIDCLSFVMCPLLAQLKIGFFAAAVYSTNEANKAGLKQSIFFDVYGISHLQEILWTNLVLCGQSLDF